METPADLAGAHGTSTDDPSGALTAQAAHEAGAVLPTVETPIYAVTLDFRVQAPEHEVRALMDGLVHTLLAHPLIAPGAISCSMVAP